MLKELLMAAIVLLLLVLLCWIIGFVIVDHFWNDEGDPVVIRTPVVKRTPRGGEPVPRTDPVGAHQRVRPSTNMFVTNANGGTSMPELLIGGVPLVALIVALVELAKQTMGLDSQYAPVTAVGLGILLAVGIQVSTLFPEFGTWFQVVVLGMVAGLLACGIYSGTKATMGGR